MVQFKHEITQEFITKNVSDREFFKFAFPLIRSQGVHIAIASFGEASVIHRTPSLLQRKNVA